MTWHVSFGAAGGEISIVFRLAMWAPSARSRGRNLHHCCIERHRSLIGPSPARS